MDEGGSTVQASASPISGDPPRITASGGPVAGLALLTARWCVAPVVYERGSERDQMLCEPDGLTYRR